MSDFKFGDKVFVNGYNQDVFALVTYVTFSGKCEVCFAGGSKAVVNKDELTLAPDETPAQFFKRTEKKRINDEITKSKNELVDKLNRLDDLKDDFDVMKNDIEWLETRVGELNRSIIYKNEQLVKL